MDRAKTRLQRKKEKESLRQAVKYLLLIFVLLFLLVRFGLPALINMAAFFGEVKSTNEPIQKTDTVPPMVPQLIPPPEATMSGHINISGYGETGSTVELYLRGINVDEVMVDEKGNFEFKSVELREGNNEIYAKSRDNQENYSESSNTYTVIMDNVAPELTVDSPSNGDRFFDKDSPITVKGISEAEADLRINGRFVMVASDGNFSTSLSLNEGDNQVEVVASDEAGNQTKVSMTVNYTP